MYGTERPLLLIDVDGVISLFGFPADRRPSGSFHAIDGIAHYLSATAGEHLLALADDYELAWCTGWEEKANEYLPHLLGLPGELPWLTFARGSARAHWKLDAIDAHAGAERALAWIDDTHDDACAAWARTRRGPTLLVATDPAVGLTGAHVERLLGWARALDGDGRATGPGAPPPG